ncbi:uncharacterized protein LOC135492267 [Lineus longissimus]|uniref:uncharacterized protein LOC135492267 n=1 Tax=Lineus longissimus TaxID=88925 RepID=UPI002B4F0C0C
MMASKIPPEPGIDPVCTVCLQTPDVLKVLTTCKHLCCVECLSKHLKSLSAASESFPCPICQKQCSLPKNGVDDLEDDGRAEECDEEQMTTESVACLICGIKGTATEAESLCQECGNMYLCLACTHVHEKNKATASHVVISVASAKGKTGGSCRKHNELFGSYCCTCEKPCCRVCVFLDHGDHEVKKIWEVFRSILQEVQRVSEEYENRSKHMKRYEEQMKFLKNCEVSSKRDVLIREIEDHSETCIQQIIKQKEELKQKVLQDFQVVRDVYGWLEKIPALNKLDEAVTKSKTLLLEAEAHPRDIEKLSVIIRQIMDSELPENTSVEKYMESFTRLFRKPPQFVPNITAQSIGGLMPGTPRSNASIEKRELVYEKELPVDDEDKYIPCVAKLSNDLYAVGHPTVPGTPSKALDIYKLPGDLQRTITDHVNPVYDIAATPDGNLAVLSDGQTQDSCSVRIFDPATGQMKTTQDVQVRSPISFDVNLCHEYVVLSHTEDGNKKVTIVDVSGSVEYTKVVDKSVIPDASRIACCGGATVLMGRDMICDAMDCRQLHSDNWITYMDISATWFGEVTSCCGFLNEHMLMRVSLDHGKLQDMWCTEKCRIDRGKKGEARLSVVGGYIVSSQDHTIRVFKDG